MRVIRLSSALLALAATIAAPAVRSQSIEPRAYSNAPVGVNFLVAGPAYATGGFSIDPTLPLRKPDLDTTFAVLAYVRSIDIGGRSGTIGAFAPYAWLNGSGVLYDEQVQRRVRGFADPTLRVSVNLYGAPSLTLKEFGAYRQDLIVGASLQVTAPLGQYDDERLVNIGANRWSLKPGIGLSKAIGRWVMEGVATVTLYTDNDDFYGGRTRSQDPVYALQGDAIYNFANGSWASVDVYYLTGGSTELDGVDKRDMQRNWRVGGTIAVPVDRRNSVKIYVSSGVFARTGNNFEAVGMAWQYRWGGGL